MARGAAQQQSLLNSQGGTSFSNAQNAYGSAMGGYESVLANPGYSAAGKAAILDPIGSSFDSATQGLYNTAARTRNNAAVTAGADQLARSKAESLSNANAGIEQTALNERDKALAGISGLYSPSLSSASSLYGNATQAMMARPSVLQDIGSVVGLGAAGAGAYTGGVSAGAWG